VSCSYGNMDNLRLLFATPILQTHLGVPDKVMRFIESRDYIYHTNGYTTDEDVLENIQIRIIKKLITKKVEDYFYNILSFSSELKLELVSSWANLHKKGDWAQVHAHYNSVISGVWYLRVSETSGKLIIHADQKLFGNLLDFPKDTLNELNGDRYAFTPKNGDMLIFPSTLKHSVDFSEDDTDRYSLAFNFMVRGNLENGRLSKVKL